MCVCGCGWGGGVEGNPDTVRVRRGGKGGKEGKEVGSDRVEVVAQARGCTNSGWGVLPFCRRFCFFSISSFPFLFSYLGQ